MPMTDPISTRRDTMNNPIANPTGKPSRHAIHASAADRLRRRGRYSAMAAASAAATAVVGSEASAAVVTSAPGVVHTYTLIAGSAANFTTWGAGGTAVLNGKLRIAASYSRAGMAGSRRAFARSVAGVSFHVPSTPAPAGGPAARLGSGQAVNAGLDWAAGLRILMSSYGRVPNDFDSVGSGGWNLGDSNQAGVQSARGFLAFRISDGASDYFYGYLDLEMSRSGVESNSTLTITIHGWAYESTPGQQIVIGGATAVSGGAGLAALAAGAAGLRGRRRSRN